MSGKTTFKFKINQNAHPDLVRYWKHTDCGRSESQRGRTIRGVQKQERNDCTVRALAVACGVSYDEAHAFCESTLGRNRYSGCHLPEYLRKAANKGLPVLGRKVVRVACQAVKGQPRMDIYKLLSSGVLKGKRAIIQEAGHVYAIVDGIGHDTAMPYEGRCVYGYWLVD